MKPILIAKTLVLVNPFEELDELLRRELLAEKKKQAQKRSAPVKSNVGIGNLLDLGGDDMGEERRKQILEQLEQQNAAHEEGGGFVEKRTKKGGFGDFSSW